MNQIDATTRGLKLVVLRVLSVSKAILNCDQDCEVHAIDSGLFNLMNGKRLSF